MTETNPSRRNASPSALEVRDRLARPLRDLRISVTDRCNFRCPYCMPEEIYGESYQFLPRDEILRFEEVERLARIFVAFGVTKLRITGGEPLLRRDLPDLIARLAGIEGVEDIALTTNGVLLERHAAALAEAGLRRVTVSLDSVDPETFRRMSGRGAEVERVFAGIEAAEAAGLSPIKLNCVVQRGVNDEQVVDLARRFRGTGHILRFIEYMDVGTLNHWSLDEVVSGAAILERINAVFPLESVPPRHPGEVARRLRYRDGAGEIGIIASVTQPFCGGCTRARLTTQGRLVTCLFAEDGIDLRTPLRAGASDSALAEIVESTWKGRSDRYSEERSSRPELPDATPRRIEMYEVGG